MNTAENTTDARQIDGIWVDSEMFSTRPRKMRRHPPFFDAMRVILPFTLLTVALLAVKPGLLRFGFPAATCFFGYRLYRKNENYFLSLLLWIYILSPLLRRLIDWKTFYQDQSPVLLAPLLITLIPAIDFRRRLMSIEPILRWITLIALFGIAYGAGIGWLKHPGQAVLLATLNWVAPIVLCVFVASIREREELVRVLTRTVLCSVLAMSLYGIYQYVVAPPWDNFWLRSIDEIAVAPSFGNPEPFGIRVWSTMNAPGPFSLVLGTFLIWLAIRETLISTAVAAIGYATLLLTLVRSAWLVTAVGLLLIFIGCRPRVRPKGFLALLFIFAILLFGIGHISQAAVIQKRFHTFSDLKDDGSANERLDLYKYMATVILKTPAGNGLDNTNVLHGYPLDSSLILLFYMLGWIGASCYLVSFLLIVVELVRRFRSSIRPRVAAASIVLALLTQSTGGDVLFRQGGVMLWLFVGVWARLNMDSSPLPGTVKSIQRATSHAFLPVESKG